MNVDLIIEGGSTIIHDSVLEVDIAIDKGVVVGLGASQALPPAAKRVSAKGLFIFPGLVDPHCHFREPGPLEEEDFITGSRAALAGGITTFLEQPVDTPPTINSERLIEKIKLGEAKSYTDFGLWGGIVPGNLDSFLPMHELGACAFKAFACSSDPVYPMTDDGAMLASMVQIKETGKLIAVHCENQAIIEYNETIFKAAESVRPIDHARSRPPIAELEAVQRMILLAENSGVRLHILHTSISEAVTAIISAKSRGLKVTVETCPHYLILTEEALERSGPYAKCNPPLRGEANVRKMWHHINNDEIDCIVSDHSPYTSEAKRMGLEDVRLAPPGINGLEVGFPLMLSEGFHHKKISLPEIAKYMSTNPAKLFGIFPRKGEIRVGGDADLVIADLHQEWTVKASQLQTKNKWSPFDGWKLKGKVIRTMVRGKTVFLEGNFPEGQGYGKFLPV